MDKQEAMDRIAAIEAEAAKLRAIVEAPEPKPPQVGRICFVSDSKKSCPSDSSLAIITQSVEDTGWFEAQTGLRWQYARIATWDELGVPWVAKAEKLLEEIANANGIMSIGANVARNILAMRDGKTK
jgi:hypothetical protein